jgi:hypothetical protein
VSRNDIYAGMTPSPSPAYHDGASTIDREGVALTRYETLQLGWGSDWALW